MRLTMLLQYEACQWLQLGERSHAWSQSRWMAGPRAVSQALFIYDHTVLTLAQVDYSLNFPSLPQLTRHH